MLLWYIVSLEFNYFILIRCTLLITLNKNFGFSSKIGFCAVVERVPKLWVSMLQSFKNGRTSLLCFLFSLASCPHSFWQFMLLKYLFEIVWISQKVIAWYISSSFNKCQCKCRKLYCTGAVKKEKVWVLCFLYTNNSICITGRWMLFDNLI